MATAAFSAQAAGYKANKKVVVLESKALRQLFTVIRDKDTKVSALLLPANSTASSMVCGTHNLDVPLFFSTLQTREYVFAADRLMTYVHMHTRPAGVQPDLLCGPSPLRTVVLLFVVAASLVCALLVNATAFWQRRVCRSCPVRRLTCRRRVVCTKAWSGQRRTTFVSCRLCVPVSHQAPPASCSIVPGTHRDLHACVVCVGDR